MVRWAYKICKYHGHLGLTWTLLLWEFEVSLVTAYSLSLYQMMKSITGKWCHLQSSREIPIFCCAHILGADISLSLKEHTSPYIVCCPHLTSNRPDFFLRINMPANNPLNLPSNGHVVLCVLASINELWNVQIDQSKLSIQPSHVIYTYSYMYISKTRLILFYCAIP